VPRTRYRMTASMVARSKVPGLYSDGGGLYLQVTTGVDGTPRRSWVFRYRTIAGKAREMGLGSALDVSLADARHATDLARKRVRSGGDPIAERRVEKVRAIAEAARAMTFRQCAEAYIEAHADSWKNPKHRQQWSRTLETYAYPVFGSVAVVDVDVAMVTKVLDPIWSTKTETASRVRGRIESVLDWAAVRGYRKGENPARWRGHLQKALPARSKIQKVRHHSALPYAEVPRFITHLRRSESVSARALEFLILTATRTGESRPAGRDSASRRCSPIRRSLAKVSLDLTTPHQRTNHASMRAQGRTSGTNRVRSLTSVRFRLFSGACERSS
jgi:hypothetical protein